MNVEAVEKIDMNEDEKFSALEKLIGNTPLVKINYLYKGKARSIYAKLEHYNLTGSIKDRMVLYILKKAYESGQIKPGQTIVEATSGNTGISFAAIGSYLGHKVVTYMPDWMSGERKNLIASFGGEVRLVSKEEGGFIGSVKKAKEMADLGQCFLPQQFSNEENTKAHYQMTAPEIERQLKNWQASLDAVVVGVGTGGTIMGLGRYFKQKNPNVKAYPLEPLNSPTLSTGSKTGDHRIAGIADEFIPPIIKFAELDGVISIDDGDAIIMAQSLSRDLGLGVGISSGANFLGAVKVQEQLGVDKVVVTVFADDNKKYFSTDYVKDQPIKKEFLSPQIKLLNYDSCR